MLLVPKHEGEYAKVGTVAEVTDRIRLPGGGRAVALERPPPWGRRSRRHRQPGPPVRRGRGATRRRAASTAASASSSGSTARSSRRSSSCAATTAASRPSSARSREPGALADTAGYSPDLTFEQKVQLLEAIDVRERLELALELQRERLALMQVRRRIQEDVESGRREAAARVHPAPPARLDPQGARRGRGAPSSRSTGRSSPRRRCPRTCSSRRSGSSRGSSGWATSRPRRRSSATTSTGCSPCRGASAPRSGSTRCYTREVLDNDHAGPRRRQGPHRRVHRGREAARGARHRGRQALRARS